MRILLANGNTTESVTELCAAEARASATAGTEIVAATGRLGANIMSGRTDTLIGGYSTLSLLAEFHGGCDAAVIAVSFDCGLAAARQILPIPVVGMTEAALHVACLTGGRFGLVTIGLQAAPLYRELVESYGLLGRLAGIRTLDAAGGAAYARPQDTEAEVLTFCRELIEADGAEAVILAAAAMAGMPRRIQAEVPVPVLDGIACGVQLAEVLVRLGKPKPTAGSYARPPAKPVTGLDPHLARLLGG